MVGIVIGDFRWERRRMVLFNVFAGTCYSFSLSYSESRWLMPKSSKENM